MDRNLSDNFKNFTNQHGGRALILFLLFGIAIYSLVTAGITAFAAICLIPAALIFILLSFKNNMFLFYVLMVVNYFTMYLDKIGMLPLPASLPNEMLEILLIATALIQAKEFEIKNLTNIMNVALMVWVGFCILEVLNDTCGIGIDLYRWFTGARLMAFQLLYAYIIFALYLAQPDRIIKFLKVWAILAIFASYWAWKQKNIGFTPAENAWLWGYARRTHVVNGIIRYFSIFSDAANFGCHMAAASVVFYIVGITSKITFNRIFFIITGIICTWGTFASGTRTAIFCFAAGFIVFIFLSKSARLAIPVTIAFSLFFIFLAFTPFGNGNAMIRRMRSAFNRNDASANVRTINQKAMAAYMKDAPWGMGLGVETNNVPAFNKFKILSQTPPDSEYVYIWVHTGRIGITLFIITTIIMILGASIVVFFRIQSPSLRGIGAAFVSGFVAIQLGGYGNQILMQFPNVLLFYGSLAIVFVLPNIEQQWIEYENAQLAKQQERKRLNEEKKRAKRV